MGNRKSHWPDPPWPRYDFPADVTTAQIDEVIVWMKSVIAWGENVRDDIIRLEAATGIGPGDPGDPPPPPWKPK